MDIEREFHDRDLDYNPASVDSEAFGEGFEECAMTWKAMLTPYLGLARPAENNFNLSVSGARLLLNATLRERLDLGQYVRLFLWEGQDGRPIGLYARACCRLMDPQYCAYVSLAKTSLEVWGLQGRYWPSAESKLIAHNGKLKVSVLNGIRRDTVDEPCYLVGDGISFADFRQRLIDAHIKES